MNPNPLQFPIHNFDLVTTETVTSFTISVSNIVLFRNASLQVRLLNATNNIIKVYTILLTGEDYTNWGGDDTYLYQYVSDKMGYTLSFTTPEPEPESV